MTNQQLPAKCVSLQRNPRAHRHSQESRENGQAPGAGFTTFREHVGNRAAQFSTSRSSVPVVPPGLRLSNREMPQPLTIGCELGGRRPFFAFARAHQKSGE